MLPDERKKNKLLNALGIIDQTYYKDLGYNVCVEIIIAAAGYCGDPKPGLLHHRLPGRKIDLDDPEVLAEALKPVLEKAVAIGRVDPGNMVLKEEHDYSTLTEEDWHTVGIVIKVLLINSNEKLPAMARKFGVNHVYLCDLFRGVPRNAGVVEKMCVLPMAQELAGDNKIQSFDHLLEIGKKLRDDKQSFRIVYPSSNNPRQR